MLLWCVVRCVSNCGICGATLIERTGVWTGTAWQAELASNRPMTRGQYLTMCIIGGVALVAYWQGYRLAMGLAHAGIYTPPKNFTA